MSQKERHVRTSDQKFLAHTFEVNTKIQVVAELRQLSSGDDYIHITVRKQTGNSCGSSAALVADDRRGYVVSFEI